MPDDRIKISALPSALLMDNTDVFAIVQGMTGDNKATKKAAVTLIAAHLLETMQHNNLDTSDKTIIGAINEVAETLEGLYPVSDASGAIANFETELARPLEALKVGIVATQASGTPTPQNPLTVSGWNSVTVSQLKSNICEELFETGFINASGVETPSTSSIRSVNYNPCDPSKNYYAVTFSDPACYIMFYDASKTFIERKQANNQIVTSSANARYFRFSCYNYGNYGEYDPVNKPVCINNPSTVTTYSAYSKVQTIVQLGDTYFGGQLIIDKTGHRQINVSCERKKISEFTWSYNSQYGFMTTGALSYVKQTANNEIAQNLKCEIYNPDTAIHTGSGGVNNTISISNSQDIRIRDNNYSDPALWAADMGDYYIVYPLATPIIIDLPDGVPIETFIGVNNIFADSGDILECKYKDTIQHYIDTQIAATQALIL